MRRSVQNRECVLQVLLGQRRGEKFSFSLCIPLKSVVAVNSASHSPGPVLHLTAYQFSCYLYPCLDTRDSCSCLVSIAVACRETKGAHWASWGSALHCTWAHSGAWNGSRIMQLHSCFGNIRDVFLSKTSIIYARIFPSREMKPSHSIWIKVVTLSPGNWRVLLLHLDLVQLKKQKIRLKIWICI